ncbi:hypothetical protein J5N97_029822 [Dioscorea zingiberensis]|uniref:PHD-type zinc finger plants domain-containing protein n=1 Tax=Dioscorea zingiberensis TaxID=325984 RepID=A0A9D5BWF5_9LILI|nr:hypothetical protein J5N97_029822 [Dioscorea zingiberensis]
MESMSTVCCMCGDVGFQDRLFQCMRCHYRSQHWYCTNYYHEDQSTTSGVCDWCLSEQRAVAGSRHASQSHFSKKQQAEKEATHGARSEYSSMDKIKQAGGEREEAGNRGKSTAGASSSKPSGRRYKLLKDVLC